jgi:ABC-type nitrate/sulfonate/bicarbonate transport system substrate-binding protein
MDDRYGASLYEIEIGIVVPAVIYAPVWLAEQRGFLRDEGLTVRLRSFGSTDGTTAALRDGIVPITIGSPEGSIANALGGGDLRLVPTPLEPGYHWSGRAQPAAARHSDRPKRQRFAPEDFLQSKNQADDA